MFNGIENAAVSNGSTVDPWSTKPMSPPLPADDGSAEFAFASAAKSAPPRSCFTIDSAFAFASASCCGVAVWSALIRMWRMCACAACLNWSFVAS